MAEAYRDVIMRIKAEADPGIDRVFSGIASRTDNHMKAIERGWSTMLGGIEQKTAAVFSRIEATMGRTASNLGRMGGGGGGFAGGSVAAGPPPFTGGGGGSRRPPIVAAAGSDGAWDSFDAYFAGRFAQTDAALERLRESQAGLNSRRAQYTSYGLAIAAGGAFGGFSGATGVVGGLVGGVLGAPFGPAGVAIGGGLGSLIGTGVGLGGEAAFGAATAPQGPSGISRLQRFYGGGAAFGLPSYGNPFGLLGTVGDRMRGVAGGDPFAAADASFAGVGRGQAALSLQQRATAVDAIQAAGRDAQAANALQRGFALNATRFDGSTGGQLSRNDADLALAREKAATEEIIRLEQERISLVQRRAQEQIQAAERSLQLAQREKAEVESTLERRRSQIAGAAEAFGFADPRTQNAARSAADKLKNGLGASLTRDELAAAQGLRGAIPGIDEALQAEGRRRADLAGFRGIEQQFGIPAELRGLEGKRDKLEIEIKNQGEIKVKLEADAATEVEKIQAALRPLLEDYFAKRAASLDEGVNKAQMAVANAQQDNNRPGRRGE